MSTVRGAKSLHDRLMLSYALCALGKAEIAHGQIERAAITVHAIWQLISEVERLLVSPAGVSATETHDSRELLPEVKKLAGELATAIPPQGCC